MGNAYVTRGVLVDIPRLRGVNWLEPTTPIFVSDLEQWEQFANVRVAPGDVLLVRTGRWALRRRKGAVGVRLGRRRPACVGAAVAARARRVAARR